MVFPCPGKRKFGAISASGSRTNRRKWARGCGRVSAGVVRISLPKAIKSRSSGRGSFNIFFGVRPNSFSRFCSFARRDSGDSPLRGTRVTAALTNFGEPAGQSTGAVSKSGDFLTGWSESSCNRSIARKMTSRESPRLEPSAIYAVSGTKSGKPTSVPTRPACRRCRVPV